MDKETESNISQENFETLLQKSQPEATGSKDEIRVNFTFGSDVHGLIKRSVPHGSFSNLFRALGLLWLIAVKKYGPKAIIDLFEGELELVKTSELREIEKAKASIQRDEPRV